MPPAQPIILSQKEAIDQKVVTTPVDTGLDAEDRMMSRHALPAIHPEPSDSAPELVRPTDAQSSPYAAIESHHPDLPAIEPVLNPPLPEVETPAAPPQESPIFSSPAAARKMFELPAPAAVLALESEIESAYNRQKYADVAPLVDRAIRIQPKNPELWNILARTRLRQHQPELAEDLAKKSNTLAKGNAELIKSNWRLISEARRARGDGIGAQDALEKAW